MTTGDKSFLFEKEKFKPAVRKPAETREVLAGHKPFLINRLAVGSYALAKIWYQAWEEGGKPQLSDANGVSIPYALDVPFLWPTY